MRDRTQVDVVVAVEILVLGEIDGIVPRGGNGCACAGVRDGPADGHRLAGICRGRGIYTRHLEVWRRSEIDGDCQRRRVVRFVGVFVDVVGRVGDDEQRVRAGDADRQRPSCGGVVGRAGSKPAVVDDAAEPSIKARIQSPVLGEVNRIGPGCLAWPRRAGAGVGYSPVDRKRLTGPGVAGDADCAYLEVGRRCEGHIGGGRKGVVGFVLLGDVSICVRDNEEVVVAGYAHGQRHRCTGAVRGSGGQVAAAREGAQDGVVGSGGQIVVGREHNPIGPCASRDARRAVVRYGPTDAHKLTRGRRNRRHNLGHPQVGLGRRRKNGDVDWRGIMPGVVGLGIVAVGVLEDGVAAVGQNEDVVRAADSAWQGDAFRSGVVS